MSIKSELTKTASYLRSVRKAILGRGGEISRVAGLKDLPDTIYKIPPDVSLAYRVDEDVAYRKIVPSGVKAFAQVAKVGGMTYKCNNLIPFPYYYTEPRTANGVTWTPNADGSITANGTQTKSENFPLWVNEKPILLNGTYSASLGTSLPRGCMFYFTFRDDLGNVNIISAAENGTKTIENRECYSIRFWIASGTVFDNVTFYPMVNEGSTALPYEPYFEGLRDTKVSALESEGANCFNFDNVYADFKGEGNKIVINSTQYNVDLFSGKAGVALAVPNEYIRNTVYLPVGTYYIYYDMEVDDTDTVLRARKVNESNGETKQLRDVSNGKTLEVVEEGYYTLRRAINKPCVISNLMITRVQNAEYKPYMSDTLEIAEEIQAIEGYGQSNPDNPDEYNYIDFERKMFIAYGYMNGDEWVAYVEPKETDISAYLTDTFIEVEGGGTITAVNEYEYDAPSTINYIYKTVGE